MNNNNRLTAILFVSTLQFSTANADYYAPYPEVSPINNMYGDALPWWDNINVMPPTLQPYFAREQSFAATPYHEPRNSARSFAATPYYEPHNNGQSFAATPHYEPHNNRQNNRQSFVATPYYEPHDNGPSFAATPYYESDRYESDIFRPSIRVQPASYKPNSLLQNPILNLNSTLDCQHVSAMDLPDHCISKSSYNRQGLEEQIRFLKKRNPNQRVADKWANISNAALLQTAHELLDWEQGFNSRSFREKFSLREIGSYKNAGNADYTGYFTPVLQVQNHPDQYYRFPIYAPPRNGTRFSRKDIDRGALNGKGLEIAWTNDKINLFFAQTQGSAIARYPDGSKRYLVYAANNNHSYGKISSTLRNKGYMRGGLSNANIRRWLHANPHKVDEVLHKNPRYIFFSLSDARPKTTIGSAVIPGHTLAVDDNYIPLGAVLLAEIPRIDHRGKRVGSDWRLLFAQDRGNAIKGPGRMDIYTGMGDHAEQATYQITGLHRTYMLVRKSGYLTNVAGM